MRFLRSNQLAPPAPPQPSEHAREKLLLGLINELAVLNGALLARAEQAEALLADAVAEHADLFPLLVKLGQLAGEALPEVASQAAELLDANSVLATRLAQGDRDLGLLTTALIGDLEPRAFETGNDQTNNE
jgi:hypothetical protein